MKNTFLLFALCAFFVACSSENSDSRLLTSSYNRQDNVLDDLYQELKEQRPDLKTLEQEIRDIDQSKDLLLSDYRAYNAKNEQGYSIALQHLANINDSLLRNSVELFINKSKYAYDQDNAAMALASATLENRSTSLHDHHEALKILLALNLMEKYQQKQKLDAVEYERIILRYNNSIHKTDSLLEAK